MPVTPAERDTGRKSMGGFGAFPTCGVQKRRPFGPGAWQDGSECGGAAASPLVPVVFIDFIDSHWVLLDSIGFYWFIGFYWLYWFILILLILSIPLIYWFILALRIYRFLWAFIDFICFIDYILLVSLVLLIYGFYWFHWFYWYHWCQYCLLVLVVLLMPLVLLISVDSMSSHDYIGSVFLCVRVYSDSNSRGHCCNDALRFSTTIQEHQRSDYCNVLLCCWKPLYCSVVGNRSASLQQWPREFESEYARTHRNTEPM